MKEDFIFAETAQIILCTLGNYESMVAVNAFATRAIDRAIRVVTVLINVGFLADLMSGFKVHLSTAGRAGLGVLGVVYCVLIYLRRRARLNQSRANEVEAKNISLT